MAESQSHGFIFEKQIIDNCVFLKKNISINYTGKWDIPQTYIEVFDVNIYK